MLYTSDIHLGLNQISQKALRVVVLTCPADYSLFGISRKQLFLSVSICLFPKAFGFSKIPLDTA
jgi:hypothetical protein